jgi:LemA protein
MGAWAFIAAVIVGFVVAWGALTRGRLAQYDGAARKSWQEIDTQLKKRWDLIPSLLEAVEPHIPHERGVLERVARARCRAMEETDLREQAEAESDLQDALFALYTTAEASSQVRADEKLRSLQEALAEGEDSIQRSRRYYNTAVRELNLAVLTFPRSLVASIFKYKPRDFYILAHEEDREMPRAGS